MELYPYFTDEETRLTDTEGLAQEHKMRWWYNADVIHVCLMPKSMIELCPSGYPVTPIGLFY